MNKQLMVEAIGEIGKNYGKLSKTLLSYHEYTKDFQYVFDKDGTERVRIPNSPKEIYKYLKNSDNPEEAMYSMPLSQEFDFNKSNYFPNWQGSSIKHCNVRLGRTEGVFKENSSFPLGVQPPVHMLMGGMTGMGKSVTINNFLHTMMYEYPPWELELYLGDFKIVEFSMYNTNTPTHIKTIAATADIKYFVSILRRFKEDMDLWNKIYQLTGVQNSKDFRKKYDLNITRKFFVIDEFQQLFEMAGKMKNEISSLVKQVTKLGRNSGYHLIFTSQGMSGTVEKEVLDNFLARACLGASESVSNSLLGSSVASENAILGRVYHNTLGDKTSNWAVVPFLDNEGKESVFFNNLKELNEMCKRSGHSIKLEYYNQEKVGDFNEFSNKVKANKKGLPFVLGDRTVYSEEYQLEFLPLRQFENENIFVTAKTESGMRRLMKVIKYNIEGSRVMEIRTDKRLGLVDFNPDILQESTSENNVIGLYDNVFKVRKKNALIKGSNLFSDILDNPELFFDEGTNVTEELIEEKIKEIENGEVGSNEPLFVIWNGLQFLKGVCKNEQRGIVKLFEELLESGPMYNIYNIVLTTGPLQGPFDYGKFFNHFLFQKSDPKFISKLQLDEDPVITNYGYFYFNRDELKQVKFPEEG